MSRKPKLYIPDDLSYGRPFKSIYDLTDDIREAHTLMLTGGSDIHPSYYGQKIGQYTHAFATTRDAKEKELIEYALSVKLPILGICRGAQFLCIAAGGSLVQDATGHRGGYHQMLTHEGKQFEMSSCHHQMLLVKKTKHEMIAWTKGISNWYLDGEDNFINTEAFTYETDRSCDPIEPEIVYFPEVNGLGIQGHPEYLPDDHPVQAYIHRLVRERLL